MDENSFRRLLQRDFPKTNKDHWKLAATSELNGSEPFNKLAWNDKDKIKFFPYYDRPDRSSLEYPENFFLAASEKTFSGARSWNNLPGITVTEELAANKHALDHLSNGADGILFYLKRDRIDLSKLIASITAEYYQLSFHGNHGDPFLKDLSIEFSRSRSSDKISGCLFWENVPQLRNAGLLLKYKNYKSLSIHVQASTPVREISDALSLGAKMISSCPQIKPQELFNMIAFSFPLQNTFLHNIAKLKSFRMLWFQVARAWNVDDYSPSDLHIHARSEKYSNEQFEPHGNMLNGTATAISAITGGADSLTIAPENESDKMMSRIARNVSNVLREESYLDKVADPLAGAYALDVMIHELSHKAWTQFQSNFIK